MEINKAEDIQNSELEDELNKFECVISTQPRFYQDRKGIVVRYKRHPSFGDLLKFLDEVGFDTEEKELLNEKGDRKDIFVKLKN